MSLLNTAAPLVAAAEPSAVRAAEATGLSAYAWLLVALPLAGAAILLLGGRATDKFGPLLATALSWASFVIGLLIVLELSGMDAAERSQTVQLWDWMSVAGVDVNVGLLVDPLSIAFVGLITFVGSLIHVYSLGYMKHDPDKRRFFAYLNLFVAAMLLLVLADSYIVLFVGWEGVGLASWLLIGFWNHNPAYATAANKAFVVNRIGDLGLILAMGLMLTHFGAFDFATVHAEAGTASTGVLTAIGLLLLLGACGKSAQFPLQSWLGDAMAGPTPVSALIHAATMVTAGVYLIARSQAIFDLTPDAQLAVAIVGAVTLLMGAIIGCAKDDIKKALAASTMSQIGYMMLAVGLGPIGYVYAIFHLITHGFFKAGMFLGAGSVMHAMDDRVDMRRFGALRTEVKITFITFTAGWLAIIGFPLTAGWYSKDYIVEAALSAPGWQGYVFGAITLLGAGITAFYMSRLYFMAFFGKARWHDEAHPHESSPTMTIPMIVLAIGSLGLGAALYPTGIITDWLKPVLPYGTEHESLLPAIAIQGSLFVLMLIGAVAAWMLYGRREVPVEAPRASVLTRAARRDLGQDDFNEAFLRVPGDAMVKGLATADRELIDGGMVGRTASGIGTVSHLLRRTQTGYVRSYALTMLVGVVVILSLVWVMH